jgi:Flp pilus assembly protein TadG
MKGIVNSMCRIINQIRSGETGSAMVETALTFPVLVIMLLGAVQLGEMAYAAIETSNAARAGAQYAAMNGGGYNDLTGIGIAAQADSRNPITTTVSSSCICSDGSGSCIRSSGVYSCSTGKLVVTVTVQTTAAYTSFVTVPGFGNSFSLQGYAQQQVLQ